MRRHHSFPLLALAAIVTNSLPLPGCGRPLRGIAEAKDWSPSPFVVAIGAAPGALYEPSLWVPIPFMPLPVCIGVDSIDRYRGQRLLEVSLKSPRFRGVGFRFEAPLPEYSRQALVNLPGVHIR
jgi:hypothetical protein